MKYACNLFQQPKMLIIISNHNHLFEIISSYLEKIWHPLPNIADEILQRPGQYYQQIGYWTFTLSINVAISSIVSRAASTHNGALTNDIYP